MAEGFSIFAVVKHAAYFATHPKRHLHRPFRLEKQGDLAD